MNRLITATTVSLVLAGTTLVSAAAGQSASSVDPKLGTRVTITGCLHQGTGWDSFVLLGVTERPADAPTPLRAVPYAIYWLDSTDGLKPLVGEIVDVTGKITERRSKPGTITVSVDPSETKSTDVEVESGHRRETTEKFADAPHPAGTSGISSAVEVSRPVYKLVVEDVHAVTALNDGPACR
ncbi:MAG TPA: hypothetical protein VIW45_01375 [Vicinamibacterales bacterium]